LAFANFGFEVQHNQNKRGFVVHEMSIAESVLQIIEDKARSDGYAKVNAVWLEIGQLAGVETESLRFCFDVVARDTVARDARLEIIETAGQGWCMECACNVAVTARYEPCPRCGSFQIEVTGGEEMRVKELEVE
jgi:hydrogenase nickel incorporation protein HypA/HybF